MSRDLYARALTAYYKAANRINEYGVQHPRGEPETCELDGVKYIVLSNINGILAVFQVRTVKGEPMLKGLKQWPEEITAQFA